jgi:hypothetical protein
MDGESFSLNESLSRDTKVLRLQYALINKECILHEKASSFYSTSYFYINITNIVFLSSTTLVNFINQIFTENIVVNIIIVVMMFITTSVSSIIHFLKFEKLAEEHSTKSNSYKSLLASIKTFSAKENIDFDEYYLWITKKYDELLLSGPTVPESIKKKYKVLSETETSTLNEIIVDSLSETSSYVSSKSYIPESNEEKYQIDRWLLNYTNT